MLKHTAALFLGLSILAAVSNAATLTYNVTLNGPSESPVNASPGTGTALITIDNVANTLRVQIFSFQNLTSNTTMSHIHCCTTIPEVGTAGVATQTPSFIGFPLGVTSGSFDSGNLSLLSASTYNPAFITANGGTPASAEAVFLAGIAAGEAYLNIHTVNFGGGEIRGFLVPEPTTMLLMSAGLGALLLARRGRA